MKNYIIIFTLVLLTFLSCNGSKPVKVGYVGTLTGGRSELGIDARNAVELAIEQLNSSGGLNGKDVELIIKDDANDPKKAEAVINELLADDVHFIIGPLMSSLAETALETIKDKDVLMISPSMSTTYLSDRDDNFLRGVPTNRGQANSLAKMASSQGKKNIAVVYDMGNKSYTETLYQYFSEEFSSLGGTVGVALTIGEDSSLSFEKISEQIVQSGADGVLFATNAIDTASLAQLIWKLNPDIDYYCGTWAMSNDLIINGGEAVEGLYIVLEKKRKEVSKSFKTFKSEYHNMFNIDPSFLGSLAYDAVQILISGLENSDKQNPESVKDTILEKELFFGLERDLRFNNYGDIIIENDIYSIIDGEFR
ncbi:MAG: ABC transporter substrate-binding protein [Spirochaetaceae bacterium]